MKTKKNQSPPLDLITPIADIFHEVCMMALKAMWELGKIAFNKILKKGPPLSKIERKSLEVRKYSNDSSSIGIDTKTKKDIPLSGINFSKHSFIVGASGFGKTNLISILQEDYLKNDIPIIFFDPKGDREAMMEFKNLCESYHKTCHIFSESYADSIEMNPLLEGTINQVADRIMRSFDWSEQFYKDMANRFLLKALKDLQKADKSFSLKNIYDVLIEKYESKEIVGLLSKLETILESDFGKILSAKSDALTISKIREEKSCLYIGLSTQGYGETAMSVGKLFLGELLYHSYKTLNNSLGSRVSMKNPIAVFFDEFGALVSPGFIELQNKCRGAGIQLTMAIQTTSDIDKISPELTNQVIENASNIFILKQRLESSASMLADTIGTYLTKKKTIVTENDEAVGKGSEREVHELLVHPDIIKNLRVGQCILLRHDPVKINLINIRNRQGGNEIKSMNKPEIKSKEAF